MIFKRKGQKAFNLIEVMLVMAIFTAVLALIMVSAKKVYTYYKTEQTIDFVVASFDEIYSYYKLSANTQNIKEQVSEVLKNVNGAKYSSVEVDYLGQNYVAKLETTIDKLLQVNEDSLVEIARAASDNGGSGGQLAQVKSINVGSIFDSNAERIKEKKQEKISLEQATSLDRWVQTSGAAERYVFLTSMGYVNFSTQSIWRKNDSWAMTFEKVSAEQCFDLIKRLSVQFFAISISGAPFLKDGKPVSKEVVEPSLIISACEDAANNNVDKHVQLDFLAPSYFSNTYNTALYGVNKSALMDPAARVQLSTVPEGAMSVKAVNNVTQERLDSLESLGAGGVSEPMLSDPCGGWKDEVEDPNAPAGCRKVKDETAVIEFR